MWRQALSSKLNLEAQIVSGGTFMWMFEQHVSSSVLMRYRHQALPAYETALLESHLLVCPVCQLQLSDLAPTLAEWRSAARRRVDGAQGTLPIREAALPKEIPAETDGR